MSSGMSSCEHISKKTGQVCGNPCPVSLKKKRCEKHGGEDFKSNDFVVAIEPVDESVNPYKPASKEWLEWNKKQKKKSKKDKEEIIQQNPFLLIKKEIPELISKLQEFNKKEKYISLSNLNGKNILKGTPVKYIDGSTFYVCKNIKIELNNTLSSHKGWGTTEIEVTRDETQINSKGQKFPINQFIIKENFIYNKELDDNLTFKKNLSSSSGGGSGSDNVYLIPDDSPIIDEKEKLLEICGNNEFVRYSENFRRTDVKSEEKYSITIRLNDLSIEELNKLFDKKIKMREENGDDSKYREFLYRKYGVKKIGGPEVKEGPDDCGWNR